MGTMKGDWPLAIKTGREITKFLNDRQVLTDIKRQEQRGTAARRTSNRTRKTGCTCANVLMLATRWRSAR